MDAAQIDELRRWAAGLVADDAHPELRPAGRAILLLIDEVERLRSSSPPQEPPNEGGGDEAAAPSREEPQGYRRRFQGIFRHAVGLGLVASLVFAALALGARLTASSLDAQGPAHPVRTRTPNVSKQAPPERVAPQRLKPDELGVVPVLMHHQIRAHGSVYDLTTAQLHAELVRLWRDGFYPVRAIDLVTGNLNVPNGRSPVVLTFDDADNNQVGFLPDGRLDPKTGLGVLEDFAAGHPDFPATATFFVPRNAFEGNGRSPASTLRWLVEHGFELGNHTKDHIPLNTLDPTGVQRQLVLGDRVLSHLLPGYRPRTMALPLGSLPSPNALAVSGRWDGETYHFAGVFLAGAEPAPSPFSTGWNPAAIPRMRTNPNWSGARDFTAGMWLDLLERNPGLRYVSDGDPETITFPRAKAAKLAPEYRSRAKEY